MAAGRKGKHKPGKVSVGIYIDEEKRALLAYIVDLSGMTATDIIMEGVIAKAQSLGVMRGGEILPKHRAAVALIMEAYNSRRAKK